MKRHVLVGRLGASDRKAVPKDADEQLTRFDLVASEKRLDHGLGHALEDLVRLGVFPTETALDLLIVAAHVHAADTRISRASESQDSWTREIRLVVPVSDPGKWTATTGTLVRMLNFLTGDRWTVGFRHRPSAFKVMAPIQPARLIGPPFNAVSLFSGGLDSLIGAIDLLHGGLTPLLVSHAGEGAVSDSQNTLFSALTSNYPGRPFNRLRLWMNFAKDLVSGVAAEGSTRGRSFLFIAAGVFAASGLESGPFTLSVPENGLIALNVPLDPLRLGALSTRTTHPFFLARWNELLSLLQLPVQVNNPYWDKTKGEMVAGCADGALLARLASASLSCSSPSKGRWKGLSTRHCGYCLPCLIRRASLQHGVAGTPDTTPYALANLKAHPLNSEQAEGQQVRSFQLAIDRLQKKPSLAALLIHKPGPLNDETPPRQAALAEVYRRGLAEVGTLIAGVRTEPG